MEDGALTSDSKLKLFTFGTEGNANCYDYTVVQGGVAELVTLDLASDHVATINETDTATFSTCEYYQDFVDLVEGGTIARITAKFQVSGDVTTSHVAAQYRIVTS